VKAIQTLHEYNILSAPVIDETGRCYKGFFAMDDVIMHLARIAKQTVNSDKGESNHIKTDQLEDLVVRKQYLHAETVIDIIGRHRGDSQFLAIKRNKPVSDALIVFGAGVQRISVLHNNAIVGILSQSKILAWIAEDTRRLGDLENTKAEDLGTPWSNVVKISKKSLTIDAVELMHQHGVFSLPLIDDDGKLVGHLSMSDFKHIILEDQNFSDLLIPLEEFVKKRVQSHNREIPQHIISARVDATFREIVLIMVKEHRVHQIYLFDESGSPKSFVSMTDVCHKLVQNQFNSPKKDS